MINNEKKKKITLLLKVKFVSCKFFFVIIIIINIFILSNILYALYAYIFMSVCARACVCVRLCK